MFTYTKTVAFRGIYAHEIIIETHVSGGSLPSFSIVGLPDKAVNESKERIRSALFSLGVAFPPKRVLINLAPANIQKEGTHYDLPILIGILTAMEVFSMNLSEYVILGELGLDGSIKPVPGVLSAAFFAASQGLSLICPGASGGEAVWGGDVLVLAPSHMLDLLRHFKDGPQLTQPEGLIESHEFTSGDFSEIRGHESAKRMLMIAAAGQHNALMMGPPGCGKSMMASRMTSILPSLSAKEALEVSMIYSVAQQFPKGGQLLKNRPFRNPHHSASMPSLVGGGIRSGPGEISLAHSGVLFLDELPEFSRMALESLRQSLESGQAVVSRANHHVIYPARFQLIAAMNPCRCGYLGVKDKQCHQAPQCGVGYRRNLSGPLLDRIDLFMDVPEISFAQKKEGGLSSADMLKFVQKARYLQQKRYGPDTLNAFVSSELLDQDLETEAEKFLIKAAEKWSFSMRSYYKMIRVARTLADLEGSDRILKSHIAEALGYRLHFYS
jgi:magnesium chelatase family protein